MIRRLWTGFLLALLPFSAGAAIGDYDKHDFYAQAWELTLQGEISERGEVDVYRFVVNTPGLVAFDVLASEYAYSSGGDRIDPVFEGGIWDPATFDDHNRDGVFSNLDAWIYLFRDDGDLTQDDYIPQVNSRGREILMDSMADNAFRLTFGDDRNGSNWSYQDPLGFFDLPGGEYLLAVGAADLTLRDAVAGSSSGSPTCSDYSGTCQAVGSYLIDIYGGDVTDNAVLIPNPIPAALPLFASALGFMGFAGWKRRRNALAA